MFNLVKIVMIMNEKRNNLSMWRYICFLGALILMLCGMILWLTSCTQEMTLDDNTPLSGKMVDVKFVVNGSAYGENEVVKRNASGIESETVVVPVNDDLYMYATLEADREINLRAASSLPPNTKLRIAAYLNGTGNAVAIADYTITNAGKLNYVSGKSQVAEGHKYTFVAYSYNSTTDLPPSHSESINEIEPSCDILWGSAEKIIAADNNEVEITLFHKLSRVTIEATTRTLDHPHNIIDIKNVTIAGCKAGLTPLSGDISKGSICNQAIDFPTLGTASITSTPRIVFTGNSDTTEVTVGSVTISGHENDPIINKKAVFSKQLQGGISYTLNVRFKNRGNFIYASPESVWLSPSQGNLSKTITVASSDAWTLSGNTPTNATLSQTNGLKGTTDLTLTRSATDFGKQTFTLRNATGDEAVVTVDNLHIENETLYISNAPALNTGEYKIFVHGGSERFTIVDYSPWIIAPTILPDGKLQFMAKQSSSIRNGYITLAHADDPDYKVTFTVIQDYNVMPPFDFLVVKFTWGGKDADVAVEFWEDDFSTKHPGEKMPPFYNNTYPARDQTKAVGFTLATNIDANGTNHGVPGGVADIPSYTNQQLENGLMFWGGDATGAQGETVFFNAKKITPDDPRHDTSGLPRYVYLQVYCAWYNMLSNLPDTIRVETSTYQGGVMRKPTADDYYANKLHGVNCFNFYNTKSFSQPAVLLYSDQTLPASWSDAKTIHCTQTHAQLPSSPTTNYKEKYGKWHFCTVEYDRYQHIARTIWHR